MNTGKCSPTETALALVSTFALMSRRSMIIVSCLWLLGPLKCLRGYDVSSCLRDILRSGEILGLGKKRGLRQEGGRAILLLPLTTYSVQVSHPAHWSSPQLLHKCILT